MKALLLGCEVMDLQGFVDEYGCDRVRGWVWDARHPDRTLDVEVRARGRLVGTARADGFRADLVIPGERSGWQAFELTLLEAIPAEWLPHLQVTVKDIDFALPFSKPHEFPDQTTSERPPIIERTARRARQALRWMPVARMFFAGPLHQHRWVSMCPVPDRLHRKIFRILLPSDARRLSLLDLGCGDAPLTRTFRFARRTFLDIAPRPRAPEPFVAADAVDFLRDQVDTEDVIVCLDMIEHLWRPRGKELLRLVTEKAGRLALFFTPLGPMQINPSDPTGHRAGWWPEELEAYGYRTWVFPRYHAPWSDGRCWGGFYAWRWSEPEPQSERRLRKLGARIGVTDREEDILDDSFLSAMNDFQARHWRALRDMYRFRLFPIRRQ